MAQLDLGVSPLDRLHDWTWCPKPGDVLAAPLRLMAVHAHPDDEASKGAATVAMLAATGVRATLVMCTGGEEGDVLNPAMDIPEVTQNLPDVRLEELAEAVEVCGYKAAYLLGYRDSGMPGAEANAHPDAFANSTFDEAVARLVRVVRHERPHVVLAYDEHEAYPHPDHIMAHRIAMAAWDAAGEQAWEGGGLGVQELGEPWEIAKLYWFHWSHRRMLAMHEEFCRRGWDSPFGHWLKVRQDQDDTVTTRVNVAQWIPQGRKALLAHRTQVDPEGFWLKLPEDVVVRLFPFEEFVLVKNRTAHVPTLDQPEHDLFEGVR